MSLYRTSLVALSLVVSTVLLSACSDSQATSEAPKPATQTTAQQASVDAMNLRVYKSPTCGCCVDWIDHVEDAGFHSVTHHPDNLTQLKLEMGLQGQYHSCHTAVSEQGYLFEGHVPAKLMQDFLEQPPADALGLAVPGMPMGSPGMEVDDRFSPYQVLLVKKDGSYEVYATIEEQTDQY